MSETNESPKHPSPSVRWSDFSPSALEALDRGMQGGQDAGREAALAYENLQLNHLLRQAQTIIDMQQMMVKSLHRSRARNPSPS